MEPWMVLVLFCVTLGALILAITVAVIYLFHQKDEGKLHLFCKSCNAWHEHTPRGPQLNSENQVVFYLYTCGNCHTTRAVK